MTLAVFVHLLGTRHGVALAHTLTERCVVVRGRRGDLYFRRRDGVGVGAAWGARIDPRDLARLTGGGSPWAS